MATLRSFIINDFIFIIQGGRHRQTISYGKSPNLNLSPRETLAQEVWDVRSIYLRQGLYNREIRKSLQGLIKLNKLTWQYIFDKVGTNQ
ncbi:hypothetical protein IQ243_00515 [Nostocales cyanobacterium LEGE 11386]|nr:hypothetical protein [Nostocales cyanobacterium LEGE 11386]